MERKVIHFKTVRNSCIHLNVLIHFRGAKIKATISNRELGLKYAEETYWTDIWEPVTHTVLVPQVFKCV